MILQDWIDFKISDINKILPNLVKTKPDSFACGYQMGMKAILIDLDRQIKDEEIEQ